MKPIMYHIPVCPFSQRLEILLALKDKTEAVQFETVDITKPRSEHILNLSGGTTALPVMEVAKGKALKESLVLMRYLEDLFPEPAVRRADAYEHGVESLMVSFEDSFNMAGYRLVMNQDRSKRDELIESYLKEYKKLNDFLLKHSSGDGPFLFESFGWAEAAYTSFLQRFWFVEYYEGVDLPETTEYARVRKWRSACLEHPAAQQVCKEEIIKLYYDYALGLGNGGIPAGRKVSSFTFEPSWQQRPMPPKDKYDGSASDSELGLIP